MNCWVGRRRMWKRRNCQERNVGWCDDYSCSCFSPHPTEANFSLDETLQVRKNGQTADIVTAASTSPRSKSLASLLHHCIPPMNVVPRKKFVHYSCTSTAPSALQYARNGRHLVILPPWSRLFGLRGWGTSLSSARESHT